MKFQTLKKSLKESYSFKFDLTLTSHPTSFSFYDYKRKIYLWEEITHYCKYIPEFI